MTTITNIDNDFNLIDTLSNQGKDSNQLIDCGDFLGWMTPEEFNKLNENPLTTYDINPEFLYGYKYTTTPYEFNPDGLSEDELIEDINIKCKRKTKYKLPYTLVTKTTRDEYMKLLINHGVSGDSAALSMVQESWDIRQTSKDTTFVTTYNFRKSWAPESSWEPLLDNGLFIRQDYCKEQGKAYTGRSTDWVRDYMSNPKFIEELFETENGECKLVDFITGNRVDKRKLNISSTTDEHKHKYPKQSVAYVNSLKGKKSWKLQDAFELYKKDYAKALTLDEESKAYEKAMAQCQQAYRALTSFFSYKGAWFNGEWVCESAYSVQGFSGRLNAVGGGFVSLPRDYQAILVDRNGLVNYDLEKAHDYFSLEDAERLNIHMPNMTEYVVNKNRRAELAAEANISVDSLKTLMLQIKYAGELPSCESAVNILSNSKLSINKLDAPLKLSRELAYEKNNELDSTVESFHANLLFFAKIHFSKAGDSNERENSIAGRNSEKGSTGRNTREYVDGWGKNRVGVYRPIYTLIAKYLHPIYTKAYSLSKTPKSPPLHKIESRLKTLLKEVIIYYKIEETLRPIHQEYKALIDALVEEAYVTAETFIKENPKKIENYGLTFNDMEICFSQRNKKNELVPTKILKFVKGKWVRVPSGNWKSSFMANRYQGREAYVMSFLLPFMKANGIDIVASCHDGVVTDRYIPQSLLDEFKSTYPNLPKHNLIHKPLTIPEGF